jgi:hypothetical protein
MLSGLNSAKIVREFGMVDYDLESVRSVCDYSLETLIHVPNVNDVREQELNCAKKNFYQMVLSLLETLVASGFDPLSVFFTDGWKDVAGMSFDEHHNGDLECSFCLKEPSGVFTWKILAIFVALIQISEGLSHR